jgi:hypothetical protein
LPIRSSAFSALSRFSGGTLISAWMFITSMDERMSIKTGLMTFLYLVFLSGLFFLHISLSAAPNHYEEQLIKETILKDFHGMIDTWKEELYFEMYDFGHSQSKALMSKTVFAQRMVDLKWKPAIKPLNDERVEIVYRNFAVIHFVQEFENKVNLTESLRKRMVFPAVLEKNGWKFDLTQLINIPYEGVVDDPADAPPSAAPNPPAPDPAVADTPAAAAP